MRSTHIIRGLLNMYPYYGDDFKVELHQLENYMTLFEVAKEIDAVRNLLRDANGNRPVWGARKFRTIPTAITS